MKDSDRVAESYDSAIEVLTEAIATEGRMRTEGAAKRLLRIATQIEEATGEPRHELIRRVSAEAEMAHSQTCERNPVHRFWECPDK